MPEFGPSGRVLLDVSGRRRNATLTGATWQMDATARCLGFSGSSQYASMGKSFPMNAYTYSLRIYTVSDSVKTLISDSYSGTTSGHRFYHIANGALTMYHGSNYVASSNGVAPLSQWNAISVTFDGTNVGFWANGAFDSQTALAASAAGSVGCSLAQDYGMPTLFAGKMASVMFHARVLSISEIRLLHSNPTAPFQLQRRRVYGASRHPHAAYRRAVASAYGVSR